MSFVDYCESRGSDRITSDLALEWATTTRSGSTHDGYLARRLMSVRIFARHYQTLDPDSEIPPEDALPHHKCRITPYLYSPGEIAALIDAAAQLTPPLRAATWQTLIGLLAVTGMRKSEACRLDDDHVDLDAATLVDSGLEVRQVAATVPARLHGHRPAGATAAAVTVVPRSERDRVSSSALAAPAWTCTTSLAPSRASSMMPGSRRPVDAVLTRRWTVFVGPTGSAAATSGFGRWSGRAPTSRPCPILPIFLPASPRVDRHLCRPHLRAHRREGPPLLLLHGYPQTNVMWHRVAPALARHFSLVVPDLPGYGWSAAPASDAEHAPYTKRAMANAMIEVMEALGHVHFRLAGHDRGGRVAYRLALDHPGRLAKLATLDIVPTWAMWHRMDARLANRAWHWMFLALPAPFPETMIGRDPLFFFNFTRGGGDQDQEFVGVRPTRAGALPCVLQRPRPDPRDL